MVEDMNFNFDNKVVAKKPFPTKILIICIAAFLIILAGVLTYVFVFANKTTVDFEFYLNNNKVSENLDILLKYEDKNISITTDKELLSVKLPKNKTISLEVLTVGYQYKKEYTIDNSFFQVKITKPTTVAELEGNQDRVDFYVYKFPNTTQIYSSNIILNLTCNTSKKTENISVKGSYTYTKSDNCGSLTVKLINDTFKPITQTCGSTCKIILYDLTEQKLEDVLTNPKNDLLITVQNTSNNKLKDANVIVYQNGVVIVSGKTDLEGKILFKNLDLGNYTIKAEYIKSKRTYSKIENNYELKLSNSAQELIMKIGLSSGGGSGSSSGTSKPKPIITDFNLDISLNTFDDSYCELGFDYTLYNADGDLQSIGKITDNLFLGDLPNNTYYLTINPWAYDFYGLAFNDENLPCVATYIPIYNHKIVLNKNLELDLELKDIDLGSKELVGYNLANLYATYNDIVVSSNIKVYDKTLPKIPLFERPYHFSLITVLDLDKNYIFSAKKGIYSGDANILKYGSFGNNDNNAELLAGNKTVLLKLSNGSNEINSLNYTSNDENYSLKSITGDFNIALNDSEDSFKFFAYDENLLFFNYPLKYPLIDDKPLNISFSSFDKNYDLNKDVVYLDRELTLPVLTNRLVADQTYYLPITIKNSFNSKKDFLFKADDVIVNPSLLSYFEIDPILDGNSKRYALRSDNFEENIFKHTEYYSRFLLEFKTNNVDENTSGKIFFNFYKSQTRPVEISVLVMPKLSITNSVENISVLRDLISKGFNAYDLPQFKDSYDLYYPDKNNSISILVPLLTGCANVLDVNIRSNFENVISISNYSKSIYNGVLKIDLNLDESLSTVLDFQNKEFYLDLNIMPKNCESLNINPVINPIINKFKIYNFEESSEQEESVLPKTTTTVRQIMIPFLVNVYNRDFPVDSCFRICAWDVNDPICSYDKLILDNASYQVYVDNNLGNCNDFNILFTDLKNSAKYVSTFSLSTSVNELFTINNVVDGQSKLQKYFRIIMLSTPIMSLNFENAKKPFRTAINLDNYCVNNAVFNTSLKLTDSEYLSNCTNDKNKLTINSIRSNWNNDLPLAIEFSKLKEDYNLSFNNYKIDILNYNNLSELNLDDYDQLFFLYNDYIYSIPSTDKLDYIQSHGNYVFDVLFGMKLIDAKSSEKDLYINFSVPEIEAYIEKDYLYFHLNGNFFKYYWNIPKIVEDLIAEQSN